jgi:hypothetical protein
MWFMVFIYSLIFNPNTYHLPLAFRLGYSSFREGGDFLNIPSFLKEGTFVSRLSTFVFRLFAGCGAIKPHNPVISEVRASSESTL